MADAQGLVRGTSALLGKDGKAAGDVPTAGISMPEGAEPLPRSPSGAAPKTATQAVLDENTAETHGFKLGDTIAVLDAKNARHEFTLVGLFDIGLDQELGYSGAVGYTTDDGQEMTGQKGFTEIDVRAADGVDARTALRGSVAAALGAGHDVRTGEQYAADLATSNGAAADF